MKLYFFHFKDDDEFTSNRGMIAGWLDTPPVSQTRSNDFGSALTGEQVIRSGIETESTIGIFIREILQCRALWCGLLLFIRHCFD